VLKTQKVSSLLCSSTFSLPDPKKARYDARPNVALRVHTGGMRGKVEQS